MIQTVLWNALAQPGNFNTAVHTALKELILKVLGADRVATQLAYHKLVGENWFR